MTTSTWRGHKIIYTDDIWLYSDTRQKVSENKDRLCGYCGKIDTKEGHDGCLGTLEGIMNACCGHGIVGNVYLQFWNGSIISGIDAEKIIELMRN